MEDSVNHDPLVFHLVHEVEGASDQLSEARICGIRVWPAPLAELLEQISGVAEPLGHRASAPRAP
jgi:hypothetical protein